jgi:hypothetical protein
MEINSKNRHTENFLVIFAIFLFFLGLYLGNILWRVDPIKRVAQIVSCEGYEEDFLKTMGFQNRDDCRDLNLSLHMQYVDDCLKDIKISNDESHDKKLLDLCVYHLFEKNTISLSSEYARYKEEK